MHLPFVRWIQTERLQALYDEHAPALLAYARSLALDRGSAEELVQQIFLALLEGRKLPAEPRPYLFRAVRNTALNRLRASSRQVPIEDDAPWFANDGVPGGSELDLQRALVALPPEQREVVMMHLWGGLSFEETGRALDISPNTAASRYRYALSSLRARLRPSPAETEE
jgi:RNA polymerase sigma-70 factor (ECF subfamily)